MSKRKPKLYRMRQLDVSQKSHFSFYRKKTSLRTLPLSFNYLLYNL